MIRPPIRLLAFLVAASLLPLGGCPSGSPDDDGTAAGPAPGSSPLSPDAAGTTGPGDDGGAAAASTQEAGPLPVNVPRVQDPPPDRRRPEDVPPGDARITFDALEHDFGRLWDSDQRFHTFTFTNTSDTELVIEDVVTTCGCTVAEPNRFRFAPGERGEISLRYDPSGNGIQRKRLTVMANTDPPLTTLTITAEIRPYILAEPAALDLGVIPIGEPTTTTFTIGARDPAFVVERVRATGRGGGRGGLVTAEAVPRAAPADFEVGSARAPIADVQVTISADAPWGRFVGSVVVTCRGRPSPDADPKLVTLSVPVSGRVSGVVRSEEVRFQLGRLEKGESFERSLRLRSRPGATFAVTEVVVEGGTLPGLTARAEPVTDEAGPAFDIVLRGDAGDHRGAFNGTILVRTDQPGPEREIALPLSGVVR